MAGATARVAVAERAISCSDGGRGSDQRSAMAMAAGTATSDGDDGRDGD
jgi:hypothetical protein